MLRISGIRVGLEEDTTEYLRAAAAKALHVPPERIAALTIAKKSVDARKKHDVHFVYSVDVTLTDGSDKIPPHADKARVRVLHPAGFTLRTAKRKPQNRPVVCGFGPAGMFCALLLARAGLAPIVLERGGDVDSRAAAVEAFFGGGALDTESNVQFGEGGAGTFSDGKLTCGVSDARLSFILSEFVRFGAPEDILYMAKPHIGTDVLRRVVKHMRMEIVEQGGEVRFHTKLCGIEKTNGALSALRCETPEGAEELPCDTLILAIGHSARDTFAMLHEAGLSMEQKPFSMGVRVEHLQKRIDRAQYGKFAGHAALGAADYKLSHRLADGRGVYTFCMCPGGRVVAAASEPGLLVTNGMSDRARDGANANAALLCDVRPADFGSGHPLAGVEFQRRWERAAFIAGGGNYHAPVNLAGAFLEDKVAAEFGEVAPTYRPGTAFADLRTCLPDFVCAGLKEGIRQFGRRLSGFDSYDAVLTGVETRSSSPVRFYRGETYESNVAGVYPCGEGAGYAGGIMSAALDGIRVACAVIEKNQ